MQVTNARAFAAAKGWTVSAVYSDEAVSGADTKRLVQRERLLAAIRGGAAPFDVVVMRDYAGGQCACAAHDGATGVGLAALATR